MKVSQGCNTISKACHQAVGYQHIYWSPVPSTTFLEESYRERGRELSQIDDDLLWEGKCPNSPPWPLPATFHIPWPWHRPSKVSHFLPMPERGCAALQLPGTAPIQLPHCQSSPQQDTNAHALAEMALSYVGMNPIMFWLILDSGLQLASFRQKITSEWRKKDIWDNSSLQQVFPNACISC